MADNVTITAGANATPPDSTVVATDDVGGVHYQIVKVSLGADGTSGNLLDASQQIIRAFYGSGSTAYSNARMDASTFALEVIDYAHHEIHGGSYYFVKGWQDIDGAGTNLDFLWVTANTSAWPHANWNVDGEAEFTMYLYEDVTTSTDGTSITIFNANRNSSNTAGVTAYSSPTLGAGGALGDGSTGGTLVWSGKIGSGKNATTNRATGYEMVAKQNTKYWFRITKAAAGTHYVDYDFHWYEHVDKA